MFVHVICLHSRLANLGQWSVKTQIDSNSLSPKFDGYSWAPKKFSNRPTSPGKKAMACHGTETVGRQRIVFKGDIDQIYIRTIIAPTWNKVKPTASSCVQKNLWIFCPEIPGTFLNKWPNTILVVRTTQMSLPATSARAIAALQGSGVDCPETSKQFLLSAFGQVQWYRGSPQFIYIRMFNCSNYSKLF